MGAGPRKLELDGEDELTGRGISYCATCDGALFRGQTVAVTGGGNSAVTEALSLAALCGHVYLICRRETLKAEQHLIQQLTERENLTLMTNTEIEQLHAGEINGFTRLSALTLKDRKTGQRTQLPVGGLFVAIGRRPSTDLVRGHLELTEEGYVQTDETTKTSLPGVFAAGDLRTKPLRQIITAASDGAVAAVMAEQYLRTAR
jgi:thioredoxin reductase (NADPH)